MDDSDSDSEVNFENRFRILVSNEITLKGHAKVVSAIAVDQTGSRVVSGNYDYSMRMYDFQGMNSKLQSFRQLEPSEGYQVRTISRSPTADQFLCVTGSAMVKVLINLTIHLPLIVLHYLIWVLCIWGWCLMGNLHCLCPFQFHASFADL
ncbi:WD repeat-containing protein 70-like [Pyrus ussuriensis x Pyrus communis]|uniref:WD repeat-containing protein 70-like n=1 Tax=Pyrus ussuriensis x Pyrus communis TaxID=2448454 RepID=A0A5N5IAB0_9ROSA|nr:WD repeat-containing protein 70-like [Pyrus ussuriensis x Pyrus communis]